METPGTAAVTGATSGIGREFAKRLAAMGHNLIITGRRRELLEEVAAELRRDDGVDVRVMVGDLTDDGTLSALERTLRGTEDLVYLVNNAGYGRGRVFAEDSADEQSALLSVHTLIPLRLTHAALAVMRPRRRGTIIMVSSLASFAPMPRGNVYAAAKAFLRIFAEGLHIENASEGITLQALVPGFTRSDFHRDGLADVPKDRRLSLLSWHTPERVVDASLRTLGRRVVCIPGFRNRLLRRVAGALPRRLLYRLLRKGRG
jgi:uncharacterized protein